MDCTFRMFARTSCTSDVVFEKNALLLGEMLARPRAITLLLNKSANSSRCGVLMYDEGWAVHLELATLYIALKYACVLLLGGAQSSDITTDQTNLIELLSFVGSAIQLWIYFYPQVGEEGPFRQVNEDRSANLRNLDEYALARMQQQLFYEVSRWMQWICHCCRGSPVRCIYQEIKAIASNKSLAWLELTVT